MALGLMHVHNLQFQTVTGGKNVVIFGAEMCSSEHIDNKKKNILVLGESSTQQMISLKQQNLNILLILQTQEKYFC